MEKQLRRQGKLKRKLHRRAAEEVSSEKIAQNVDAGIGVKRAEDAVSGVDNGDLELLGAENPKNSLANRVQELTRKLPNSKLRNQGNMMSADVHIPGVKKGL